MATVRRQTKTEADKTADQTADEKRTEAQGEEQPDSKALTVGEQVDKAQEEAENSQSNAAAEARDEAEKKMREEIPGAGERTVVVPASMNNIATEAERTPVEKVMFNQDTMKRNLGGQETIKVSPADIENPYPSGQKHVRDTGGEQAAADMAGRGIEVVVPRGLGVQNPDDEFGDNVYNPNRGDVETNAMIRQAFHETGRKPRVAKDEGEQKEFVVKTTAIFDSNGDRRDPGDTAMLNAKDAAKFNKLGYLDIPLDFDEA